MSGIAVFLLLGVNLLSTRGEIAPRGFCKNCNVILISIGPLRAKSLPCYGYEKDSAPNLCRFGSQSVLFTDANATASKTLDASFSMMTSLYPESHHMNVPFVSVLDSRIETLPQILERSGYRTYFLGPIGDPHLPLSLGFGRGFDEVHNADDPNSWIQTLDEINAKTPLTKQRFFAFLHTYAVHEPYLPKEESFRKFYSGSARIPVSSEALCAFTVNKLTSIHPDRFVSLPRTGNSCDSLSAYQKRFAGSEKDFDETYTITNTAYWDMFAALAPDEKARYTHALYLATIYEFDQELQRFFDDARTHGLFKNTMVVITGDHGDEFYEHGDFSHGGTLYDEVIHVPLIISVPGLPAAKVDKLVSSVDVMPTILDVLGIRPPSYISGINILSSRLHRLILSEHVSDGLMAMMTRRYKMTSYQNGPRRGRELFDRESDPGEQKNLNTKKSDIVVSLLHLWGIYQLRLPSFTSQQKSLPIWLHPQERQQLIRTGYF